MGGRRTVARTTVHVTARLHGRPTIWLCHDVGLHLLLLLSVCLSVCVFLLLSFVLLVSASAQSTAVFFFICICRSRLLNSIQSWRFQVLGDQTTHIVQLNYRFIIIVIDVIIDHRQDIRVATILILTAALLPHLS